MAAADDAEANAPEMTSAVMAALESLHHDPFVQAAVWRTFVNAPELLSAAPRIRLGLAIEQDTPL